MPLRTLRRCDPLHALAALVAATVGFANLVWALSPGDSWLDDLLPPVGPFPSTPIFASFALPAGVALLRNACAFAEEHALRLAVLSAGVSLLPLYEQAGLRAFYIGDEAIVETEKFGLEGRAIRTVRQSVSRLERRARRRRSSPRARWGSVHREPS